MDALPDFAAIALLTHPLSLVGFVLLLFIGIHRTLIKSGIIPPLEVSAGGPIMHSLLRYGFVAVTDKGTRCGSSPPTHWCGQGCIESSSSHCGIADRHRPVLPGQRR